MSRKMSFGLYVGVLTLSALLAAPAFAQVDPGAPVATEADAGVAPADQPDAGATEVQPVAQPEPQPEVVVPAVAPEAKQGEIEEIVVTGSRINRADLNTPAPVSVVTRDQLTKTGRASVGDVLQALPAQSNAINTQYNNGGDGSTEISLRGLGASRTLVLLNGRRFVASGVGGGVDLNAIPMSAIERVEVLKDGASAIYGSDAVGGVVNIITRKNWSGTEINIMGGTSNYGDGHVIDFSAATGQKGERWSFLVSGGYYKQWQVMAGDRDWTSSVFKYDFKNKNNLPEDDPKRLNESGSYGTPQGVIFDDEVSGPGYEGNDAWKNVLATDPTGYGVYTRDATSGQWRLMNDCGNAGSKIACPDGTSGDLYNFQPRNYVVTPQQRIHLFVTGNLKLSENTKAFVEASFVNRESAQQLAPTPFYTFPGIIVSKDNYFNPFGRDFSDMGRRMVEAGDRTQDQEVNTFRIVAGFQGHLPEYMGFLHGWFWETSINYGRTIYSETDGGNLIKSRMANAVGPSFKDADGVVHCGSVDAPIDGCVPMDMFDGPGTISPEAIKYVAFTGVSRAWNDQAILALSTSGDLFHMWANQPVSLALGYELRHEAGAAIPDPLTATGDTTGNASEPANGAFTVNELYGELSIPIVSNVPGAHVLEISAAGRVFDYNTFGWGATGKLGLRWSPIRDVTLRGTLSSAFRAPTIGDLYGGSQDSYPSVVDPCDTSKGPVNPTVAANCAAQGVPADFKDPRDQLLEKLGSNKNLTPERAITYTAGVVIEPRWVKDLSLTVDYYHIKITDSITTVGASTLLALCYTVDAPTFCDKIIRDPASHKVSNIIDTLTNVGGDETAGLDFGLRYEFNTPIGRFGVNGDVNWLQMFDETEADGTVLHGKGVWDLGNRASVRAIAGVRWGYKGIGIGFTGRFVTSFKECISDNCNTTDAATNPPPSRTVAAYAVFDMNLGYDLKSSIGTTGFNFGINNLANVAPPKIYTEGTYNTDPSTYDMMGRYFYLRISQAF